VIWGVPRILGSKGDARSKLSIGDNVWLNIDCSFELGESITIDDNVSIGPEVRILTTSHDLSEGTEIRRAMSTYEKPVRIGSGSWIGARVLILPGVTIGKGAVVAAGSLVRDDVPDNVLVAGVPARVIKQLP
jgi:maltose O-acetyltransferase